MKSLVQKHADLFLNGQDFDGELEKAFFAMEDVLTIEKHNWAFLVLQALVDKIIKKDCSTSVSAGSGPQTEERWFFLKDHKVF